MRRFYKKKNYILLYFPVLVTLLAATNRGVVYFRSVVVVEVSGFVSIGEKKNKRYTQYYYYYKQADAQARARLSLWYIPVNIYHVVQETLCIIASYIVVVDIILQYCRRRPRKLCAVRAMESEKSRMGIYTLYTIL